MLKNDRVALALVLLSISGVSPHAESQPLFESDEPLSIILELPLTDLLKTAKKKPTVNGVLRYRDTAGIEQVLEVGVSTRGKSRLEQCSLAPLSINLKRDKLESTLFAGQNKLKLVTQCRGTSVYARYLKQEYAIYKAYNLMTEHSFRVRMLEVTYRDTTRGRDRVEPAFFIESDKAVATRHGMTTLNTNRVYVRQLDPQQLSILSLFQYMIGNTDWSARKGPGTEGCCHNGKLIGPPESDQGWVVLPYDFDQSGIIKTKYSAPSDLLPIRSVRQRLYRGYCKSNEQLELTIKMFNEKRTAIENVLGSGPERDARNKSTIKYIGGFYEIINNPKKQQKKIIDACLRAR